MVSYSKLKDMVKKRGITLNRFSEKIGITRQGLVPAIENETVSARVLMKMSEALGVPVSSFFDETEPVRDAKDSQIIELQQKYIASLEKRLEEYEGKP